MSPRPSTAEVVKRLEILWRKLEDEGRYVSANTVSLAIEEIKRPKGASPDLLIAARCALGHLTGNMDGDMDLGNPVDLLRASIATAEGQ